MSTSSDARKRDHLALCATDRVRFKNKTTLLEQVDLIHRALPELSLEEIDLETQIAGKTLSAPLWIGAMTGGTAEAVALNAELAGLAEERAIGLCLGSLRPMLDDPSRKRDYAVRPAAPTALLLGNIGATEIVRRGPTPILDAVAALDADGLTVHLNPVMELIQPGGDTDFRGVTDAIASLVEAGNGLPVVVKECGAGLSIDDATLLRQAGVTRIETGGAGGTSWVGVETLRSAGRSARLGEMLWDWGVPTAAAVAWFAARGFEVVAAGGVRSGLDMARAHALGAKLSAVAAPLIHARFEGGVAAMGELLDDLVHGLRLTLLACGVRRPADLREARRVIGPDLARWLAVDDEGAAR